MRGGVRHELQVVGGVFVVARDVQRHHALEEHLGEARCALKRVSRFTSNRSHAEGGGSVPLSGGVASAASRHKSPLSQVSMRSP